MKPFRVLASLGVEGWGSPLNTLLWIVGELAQGWSVAMTVDFSDMWQVTGDRWHKTGDRWHMKHDSFPLFSSFLQILLILVLLTAHAERFSVSRMRDFFLLIVISANIEVMNSEQRISARTICKYLLFTLSLSAQYFIVFNHIWAFVYIFWFV